MAEPVEELLTEVVLTRLDSAHLGEVLAGKSSPDRDVAALATDAARGQNTPLSHHQLAQNPP